MTFIIKTVKLTAVVETARSLHLKKMKIKL